MTVHRAPSTNGRVYTNGASPAAEPPTKGRAREGRMARVIMPVLVVLFAAAMVRRLQRGQAV
jgi:hypothetical protein